MNGGGVAAAQVRLPTHSSAEVSEPQVALGLRGVVAGYGPASRRKESKPPRPGRRTAPVRISACWCPTFPICSLCTVLTRSRYREAPVSPRGTSYGRRIRPSAS
jgi:hypothetical protein